jgi:hypothetical protein
MIFSDIEFIKVNEFPLGTDSVNKEIEEWSDAININYITHKDLVDKLD